MAFLMPAITAVISRAIVQCIIIIIIKNVRNAAGALYIVTQNVPMLEKAEMVQDGLDSQIKTRDIELKQA